MIYLITGPVCAGKSRRLISHLSQYKNAFGGELAVFRPKCDTRDEYEAIVSRDGPMWRAHRFSSILDLQLTAEEAEVIAIDEVHLVEHQGISSEGFISLLTSWSGEGKTIYAAGLLTDAFLKPFKVMHDLALHAYDIKVLTARCAVCEKSAIYSKRLVEGTEQFMVGDKEYEPRCIRCW